MLRPFLINFKSENTLALLKRYDLWQPAALKKDGTCTSYILITCTEEGIL